MNESTAGLPDTALIRNQIQVLRIAEGFFESSVLSALLKLKVFELLDNAGRSVSELATTLGTRPELLVRLLNAGVVLKLLERDGSNFRLTPTSQSVLTPSAGENYLGNWLRNLDYFQIALSRLDQAILNGGPTVEPSTHLGGDQEHTRNFALAMHNYASLRGKELATFLDTSGSKTLLDLGSGPGTYAFHLGMRNPDLELYLLDLPGVLEVAKEVQSRYPVRNRVHYLPLNVMKDEVPGTYDIILVSNTLQMLGEPASRGLLKRLYRSVNPGGSLVVQAQYLDEPSARAPKRWPILLDLVQLCITSEGRNHSVAETLAWLEEAGFSNTAFCRMTLFNVNSYLRGYRA